MGICCRKDQNQSVPNPAPTKGRPNLQINIPSLKNPEKESREIIDLALQKRAIKSMHNKHLQIDQSPLFQKRKSLKLNQSFEHNVNSLNDEKEVQSAKVRRHKKPKRFNNNITKDGSKPLSVGANTP